MGIEIEKDTEHWCVKTLITVAVTIQCNSILCLSVFYNPFPVLPKSELIQCKNRVCSAPTVPHTLSLSWRWPSSTVEKTLAALKGKKLILSAFKTAGWTSRCVFVWYFRYSPERLIFGSRPLGTVPERSPWAQGGRPGHPRQQTTDGGQEVTHRKRSAHSPNLWILELSLAFSSLVTFSQAL